MLVLRNFLSDVPPSKISISSATFLAGCPAISCAERLFYAGTILFSIQWKNDNGGNIETKQPLFCSIVLISPNDNSRKTEGPIMIIPIFCVFSTQIFHHLLVQYTRRSSADTELPLVCGELHHNYLLITLPAFHVTLFLSDRPRTENRYNDRLLHSIISSVFFPPSWKNMPPLPLQTDHSIDPFFET